MHGLDGSYGVFLLILRLICLMVGLFVIYLGYRLIIKGITGEFKFSSEYKGIKGGLVSSSPGLLFVLLGAIICISSLYINRPYEVNAKGVIKISSLKSLKDTSNLRFAKVNPDTETLRNVGSDNTVVSKATPIDSIVRDTSNGEQVMAKQYYLAVGNLKKLPLIKFSAKNDTEAYVKALTMYQLLVHKGVDDKKLPILISDKFNNDIALKLSDSLKNKLKNLSYTELQSYKAVIR